MPVDVKLVAQLREMTGAGMMDAKRALDEMGGDLDKAADELRKRGIAKAVKKADRLTKEGRIEAYVHGAGKLAVLVEVLCETDFVAKNQSFVDMCHDLALHVSASDPLYVTRDAVPLELIEKEKEIGRAELAGKPDDIVEKILEGKLEKFYQQIVLMEQPFIKDDTKTVEEYLKGNIAVMGENLVIRRFARFQIG